MMLNTACYFPFVPNKQGELMAVSHLSPRCRARTRVVYEIDRPAGAQSAELEQHIAEAVNQIVHAWGTRYPLLVDLPGYGPEHRMPDGTTAIDRAYLSLRQMRMVVVPVVGPISARGVEVIHMMRDVVSLNRCGAALRIPFLELSQTDVLQRELQAVMRALALDPGDIDLLLDLEATLHIPKSQRSVAHLTAVVHEALAVISAIGNFRNVIVCGSSVPESVGKEYDDVPYRGQRIELEVWRGVCGRVRTPVCFSDYCITAPRGNDPRGFGSPPPPRVRLSTPHEHVFYRGKPNKYVDLCKRVVSGSDFDPNIMAWGAASLSSCANEHIRVSSPTTWVARDTNLHIETTLAEVERYLSQTGRIADYTFPEVEVSAWLQRTIFDAGMDVHESKAEEAE